jgi:hypothetical protein
MKEVVNWAAMVPVGMLRWGFAKSPDIFVPVRIPVTAGK